MRKRLGGPSRADDEEETKATDLLYIRQVLKRLECYQLCESVISISAKRDCSEPKTKQKSKAKSKLPKSRTRSRSARGRSQSKPGPSDFEYQLEFDKSTGLKPMWVDYESLSRLSCMRAEHLPSFFTSDATGEAPRAQTSMRMGPSRTPLRETTQGKCRKRVDERTTSASSSKLRGSSHRSQSGTTLSKSPRLSTKPIKQLGSLVDEDNMGRRINFETHAMCHHCKRVRPIATDLIRCKYNSMNKGIAAPNPMTINGVSLYNSMALRIMNRSRR